MKCSEETNRSEVRRERPAYEASPSCRACGSDRRRILVRHHVLVFRVGRELQRISHHDLPLLAHTVRLDHSLDLTEADAQSNYDSEEQNNIAVYKRALPAVVNITSTTVAVRLVLGARCRSRARARASSWTRMATS